MISKICNLRSTSTHANISNEGLEKSMFRLMNFCDIALCFPKARTNVPEIWQNYDNNQKGKCRIWYWITVKNYFSRKNLRWSSRERVSGRTWEAGHSNVTVSDATVCRIRRNWLSPLGSVHGERANLTGLDHGCIEADFCDHIFVEKLSPRSTQCTSSYSSQIFFF